MKTTRNVKAGDRAQRVRHRPARTNDAQPSLLQLDDQPTRAWRDPEENFQKSREMGQFDRFSDSERQAELKLLAERQRPLLVDSGL